MDERTDNQKADEPIEELEDLELRDEAHEVRGGSNEVAIEGFGSFETK